LKPFISLSTSLKDLNDVILKRKIVENSVERKVVMDTDRGDKIKQRIADLSAELND
jgi:Uncharacterized protein conserved in bacteria